MMEGFGFQRQRGKKEMRMIFPKQNVIITWNAGIRPAGTVGGTYPACSSCIVIASLLPGGGLDARTVLLKLLLAKRIRPCTYPDHMAIALRCLRWREPMEH